MPQSSRVPPKTEPTPHPPAKVPAEIRMSEQAALLAAASDAITVRGIDHTILYWNQGAERAFGWTAAEALGRDARELLRPAAGAFEGIYDILMREGSFRGELELRARDGRPVIAEASWTLVRDPEGRPDRVLTIATDVSERRSLERQLINAQRLEGLWRLAGGIAHDLNNVLTPIVMSAGLLRRPGMDAEDAALVDAIAGSAQRGVDMVARLVGFARGMEGEKIAYDIGEAVHEAERIVADTFPRNIEIRTEVASGCLLVRGDPTQMQQVLINLFVNARDAMPAGGRIQVSVDRVAMDSRDHVRIRMADTGSGMPPMVQERIFDPFFTTKEPGKGTGLGLSTSLAIVRRHGGSITAESAPGSGATFTIMLPACEEAAETPKRPGRLELPRGRGQKVLVVDDEAPVVAAAERTLRAFGYQALAASNGAEAIALLAKMPNLVDLVVIDMMMPVMDGPMAIPALLKIRPDLPVIATSGIGDDERAAAARAAGARYFLAKPYSIESLLGIVHETLQEAR